MECVSSEENDSDNQTLPPYTLTHSYTKHLAKPSLANYSPLWAVTGDSIKTVDYNFVPICSKIQLD